MPELRCAVVIASSISLLCRLTADTVLECLSQDIMKNKDRLVSYRGESIHNLDVLTDLQSFFVKNKNFRQPTLFATSVKFPQALKFAQAHLSEGAKGSVMWHFNFPKEGVSNAVWMPKKEKSGKRQDMEILFMPYSCFEVQEVVRKTKFLERDYIKYEYQELTITVNVCEDGEMEGCNNWAVLNIPR